jgi:Putative abortive phage resistance protein AbiGi, antitoxin
MKLYHSFPAPTNVPDSIEQDEFGLAILESMLNMGLLLNPEFLQIPAEDSARRDRKGRVVHQTRFCFTLIDQGELLAHSVAFGRFAISVSLLSGQRMGAVPVFYINGGSAGSDAGFTGLGVSLLNRFFELEGILNDFQALLSHTEVGGEPTFLLPPRNSPDNAIWSTIQTELVKQRRVEKSTIRNILAHVTRDRENFGEYIGAIRTFFHLFYWVGKNFAERPENVRYWLEREWRIVGGLSVDVGRGARRLTCGEAKVLSKLSGSFGEHINIDGHERPITDLCLVIDSIDALSVRDLLEEIIVPEGALERARELARPWGLEHQVVSLGQR